MGWTTTLRCYVRDLFCWALGMAVGCFASAQTGGDALRCTANNAVVPILFGDIAAQDMGPLNMTCSGGPSSTGSTDISMLIDNGTPFPDPGSAPLITVSYDQCSHMGSSILCPPGVAAGSNSQFFDSAGNVVFPGPVTVAPGSIFSYIPPTSYAGTVSGDSVVWTGVPVIPSGRTGDRAFRFTNLRATPTSSSSSPKRNRALFGRFSASNNLINFTPSTSLAPGTNKFLLGVAMPGTGTSDGFCESPLVVASDLTPFGLIRQVAVGGTNYDAIVTFSGPNGAALNTLDLYAYTPSGSSSSCTGSSLYNPSTGALDLQRANYEGTAYWGQAERASSGSFINLRYGTGTMPSR